MHNEKITYVVLVLFAFLVMAGFYVVFDKIATLSSSVKNMELTFEMKNRPVDASQTPGTQETPSPASTSTAKQETNDTAIASAIIPSAIIFETLSSPTLAPRAPLTITIERAIKLSDNTIRIGVKVFTAQASSYSAISFDDLVQIVNLDGNNEKASKIIGSFSSMPPKSAVSGELQFEFASERNTFILQTGSGDSMKFYEFDFGKKTYKETVIG